MKTETRDKYDDEVDRLVKEESGEKLSDLWNYADSPLFSYLGVSRDGGGKCGCPSMVHHDSYWQAATDELTKRIRSDEFGELPSDAGYYFRLKWNTLDESRRRSILNLFARAQRLADEMIFGRSKP